MYYTPLNYLPKDRNWTLEELNTEQIKLLIPSLIFTSISMMVGVVGNSLVIFIYLKKFKPSIHKYAILMLAFNDIVSCLIGMPFLIVDMLNAYTFTSGYLCKVFKMAYYYTGSASLSTLFFIAVYRYLKIRYPFKYNISITTTKKMLIFIATVVAGLMSFPSFFMYGKSTISTGVNNVTGFQCFTDDSVKMTSFPAVYNIVLLSIITLYGVVMVFCYFKITRPRYDAVKHVQCSSETKPEVETQRVSISHNYAGDVTYNKSVECSASCQEEAVAGKTNRTKPKFDKRNLTRSADRTYWRERRNKRMTKIFVLITALFSISFIPHCVLMIITFVWEQFLLQMSSLEAAVYHVAIRSFVLISVVNPFVYGAYDRKFKLECRKIILNWNK